MSSVISSFLVAAGGTHISLSAGTWGTVRSSPEGDCSARSSLCSRSEGACLRVLLVPPLCLEL